MFFSQLGYAFDMTKCELPETPGKPKNIYLGEISGPFKVGAPCNIKYVNLKNATNTRNVPEPLMIYSIKEIEVLMSVDEDKPYKDFKPVLRGGFENLNNNIKTAKDILKNRPSPK